MEVVGGLLRELGGEWSIRSMSISGKCEGPVGDGLVGRYHHLHGDARATMRPATTNTSIITIPRCPDKSFCIISSRFSYYFTFGLLSLSNHPSDYMTL